MGLTNLGATCYVNTFLQMWFLNLELRQALYLCPSTCSEYVAGEGIPKDKGGWKVICCEREWFCSFSPKILHADVCFGITFLGRIYRWSSNHLSNLHTIVFESITWLLGINGPLPKLFLKSEWSRSGWKIRFGFISRWAASHTVSQLNYGAGGGSTWVGADLCYRGAALVPWEGENLGPRYKWDSQCPHSRCDRLRWRTFMYGMML